MFFTRKINKEKNIFNLFTATSKHDKNCPLCVYYMTILLFATDYVILGQRQPSLRGSLNRKYLVNRNNVFMAIL